MCKGPGEGQDGDGEDSAPPPLLPCWGASLPGLPCQVAPSTPNLAGIVPGQAAHSVTSHCPCPVFPPSPEPLITQTICSLGGIWGLIRFPGANAEQGLPVLCPYLWHGWASGSKGHLALAGDPRGPSLHTGPSSCEARQAHLLRQAESPCPSLGLCFSIWSFPKG